MEEYSPSAKSARWDWYQSTVLVQCPQQSGLVDHLLRAWPLSDWVPAKNLNGYLYGGAVKRGDKVLCHACWGGNTGVNCKTTSDESPVLAEALRSFHASHLPTRVDACMDWVESGLYDSLAAFMIEFAMNNRLSITQQGDWIRNEGRTLYVGSKDSVVRLVLYEKGYEQGGNAPREWVRVEVRIRPDRKQRQMVSTWSAETAFEAGWCADAFSALGWEDLKRKSVGKPWVPSDDERARLALCKQYKAILEKWVGEVGTWEDLGPAIRRLIEETA